jgi:hypothetical protein
MAVSPLPLMPDTRWLLAENGHRAISRAPKRFTLMHAAVRHGSRGGVCCPTWVTCTTVRRMVWQTGPMVLFRLNGEVSSESLSAIQPLLAQFTGGQVTATSDGLHVEGAVEGTDARDVNRRLLSALRRVEKRTRLRAEWTAGGTTYRFFDYVPKSERPA